MRRWLAVVALVPAVAWGQQMTPQECLSQQVKMEFTRIALAVIDHKEDGVPEYHAVRSSLGDDQASAIMLEAVNHIYRSSDPSPGDIASVMVLTCHDYANGR